MDTNGNSQLVEFIGPFSWLGEDSPSVFEAPIGRACGLYIWSVEVESQDVIYYVGLTQRTFAERFLEHFKEHASGGYHLYDPIEFAAGRKVQLWPAVAALAKLYRFHLAPLSLDQRSLERIEAGLANYLYAFPGLVGAFQDTGIQYRPRKPNEAPIEVAFNSQVPLLGLPPKLSV